jgi:hypothetical protein
MEADLAGRAKTEEPMAVIQRVSGTFARWTTPLLLLAGACGGSGTSSPPHWLQYHGDGANQGFLAVNTAASPRQRWSLDLGDRVRFSSAVCDAAGDVYVAAGPRLVKASAAGQVLWAHDFAPAYANSTPAVALDGRVYVVTNLQYGDQSYGSELHCLSGTGNVLWSRTFAGTQPAPAHGAPKIWERARQSALFVYASDRLYAFSLDGRLLTAFDDPHHCTVVYGSSWFWDTVLFVWNAIKSIGMQRFDLSALEWYEDLQWPDPTPAVVAFERTPYESKPLVVTADFCGMAGIQWDPDGERFSLVWTYNHGEAKELSTPAVSATGTLAVVRRGDKSAVVQFFDILDDPGRPSLLGERDIQDESIGMPAAVWMGAYFYVAAALNLVAIGCWSRIHPHRQ